MLDKTAKVGLIKHGKGNICLNFFIKPLYIKNPKAELTIYILSYIWFQ